MEKKLLQKFEALETQRNQLLEHLSHYSSDQLNTILSPDTWSVNQIICHLMLAEELSCKSIKAKVVSNSHFEKAGIMSGIRTLLLKISLRSPRKFKAPLAVSKMPEKSEFSDLCF